MSGLLHKPLLDWRRKHDEDYYLGGSQMKFASLQLFPEVKKTIATFFGAKESEVALVPNFSLGFNLLLEGLPSNLSFLLLRADYPSVNWPVEDRDFNVNYVDIDENLEENIYEMVRENHIDVLVLSLVQWINGIFVDLDFLKKLKSDFSDLLIIADGTQFCGVYNLDFETSGIDVIGTSGYKWLLGGYGNGFFLIREEAQKSFSVKAIGSGSIGGKLNQRYEISFCKYLEPGHLDSLNFGSLKFSMDFLIKIGLKAIEEQNRKLSQKAHELFCEEGLLEQQVALRNTHSTIFNINGDTALFNKLIQEKVICSLRGTGIRLSFHFYNTLEEVEKITATVKKYL